MPFRFRVGLRWLLLGAIAACGCEQRDQECLTRVARKLLEKSLDLSVATRQRLVREFPALSAAWEGPSVEARVESRLRADKRLAGTAIVVKAAQAEIELTGKVSTPEQKKTAIELAESTVGVDKVTDTLAVEEKPGS